MPRHGKENKNLDFEIAFYEGILKRDPNLVDVLIPLGNAYTKRGLHEKGLEVDLCLCRLRPKDPIVLYNLACSYSLLGQIASAVQSLEKAFALGYYDLELLASDPDMENLRKDPRLNDLLEKYAKKKRASK